MHSEFSSAASRLSNPSKPSESSARAGKVLPASPASASFTSDIRGLVATQERPGSRPPDRLVSTLSDRSLSWDSHLRQNSLALALHYESATINRGDMHEKFSPARSGFR